MCLSVKNTYLTPVIHILPQNGPFSPSLGSLGEIYELLLDLKTHKMLFINSHHDLH